MITSSQEFYRLRNSGIRDEYNRAYRDSAPESVWLEVIDRYPDMRYWVAVNKTVPVSILRILANDEDEKVRTGVASRRKLDYDLFEKLSKDQAERVRAEIVNNKKVPVKILKELANDEVDWVAQQARETLTERIRASTDA